MFIWLLVQLMMWGHRSLLTQCHADGASSKWPWLCRLRNREQYQDFLKALNLYASEIVSKSELQQMVHDILARYPDLMVRSRQLSPCTLE